MIYALISSILVGFMGFLYKKLAKDVDPLSLTFWQSLFSFLFSLIFLKYLEFNIFVIFIVLNSLFFVFYMYFTIKALRIIQGSTFFPLSVIYVIFTTIVSILFFEKIQKHNVLGIVISSFAIYLLAYEGGTINKKGISYTFLAYISRAISHIFIKLSTVYFNPFSIIIISNLTNALFCFLFNRKIEIKNFQYFLLLGLLSFLSFYFAILGFKENLALTAVILNLSFVFSTILSIIFFREILDLRKTFGIILAIISIPLLQ